MRIARRVLATGPFRGIRPDLAWFDHDPACGGQVLCVSYDTGRTWIARDGKGFLTDTRLPLRRVLEFVSAGADDWRLARTLVELPLETAF
jgi:hypothetical protein